MTKKIKASALTPAAFAMSAPRRLIKSGFNINSLRTNDLLRKDEWKELDATIIDVSRQQLVGIADLISMGLTHPLGGLGTIISEYEQLKDMDAADVDMDAATPAGEDTPGYELVGIPVPIVHKGFRISIRRLEASRRLGDSLDTTAAQVSTRKVRDALETLLFLGTPALKVGTSVIYGYTTHPDINTGSAGTGEGWGEDVKNVYPAINTMISDLEDEGFFGPYGVYASRTQYAEAREVHTDGSGQSGVARVLENLPDIRFFKASDQLVAGSILLVQLTSDVVDLAIAQDIVMVEWDSMGGMVEHFKVLAAMVPRIKSDAEGNCGIAYYTGY